MNDVIAGNGIGDVNGTEMGTGARFNTGKTPLHLVPLRVVARTLEPPYGDHMQDQRRKVRLALIALGEFQAKMGNDQASLAGVMGWTAQAAGLTMPQLFDSMARVLDFGRKKYAEWNWARGMPYSVVIGAMARHLLGSDAYSGMWDDPVGRDPESGELHAGHVACNVGFLLQYLDTYRKGDDRPGMLRDYDF